MSQDFFFFFFSLLPIHENTFMANYYLFFVLKWTVISWAALLKEQITSSAFWRKLNQLLKAHFGPQFIGCRLQVTLKKTLFTQDCISLQNKPLLFVSCHIGLHLQWLDNDWVGRVYGAMRSCAIIKPTVINQPTRMPPILLIFQMNHWLRTCTLCQVTIADACSKLRLDSCRFWLTALRSPARIPRKPRFCPLKF